MSIKKVIVSLLALSVLYGLIFYEIDKALRIEENFTGKVIEGYR